MLEQQLKLENNKIDIPNEYLCPISLNIMEDPVIAEDGHSYERSEITHWFNRNLSSPKTGLKLTSKNLIPNHNLRNTIQDFIKKANDEIEEKGRVIEKKPLISQPPLPVRDELVEFGDFDGFAMSTTINISDLEYQRDQLLDWSQLSEAQKEALRQQLEQQQAYNLKLRNQLYREATSDSKVREYEKSLKQINHRLENDPYNPKSLNTKAILLRDLNRYEEALETLDHGILHNPDNEFLLNTRGNILKNCGLLGKALDDFKKVTQINPNNGYAISGQKSIQLILSAYETAKKTGEKSIVTSVEKNAEKPEVMSDVKPVTKNPKSFGHALPKSSGQPTTTVKDDAKVLNSQATVQKKEGHLVEALAILNDALLKYPRNCHLLCNRGDVMSKMGDYQQAIKEFDIVLALEPKNEFAQKGKAFATKQLLESSFLPIFSTPKPRPLLSKAKPKPVQAQGEQLMKIVRI